MQRFRLFFLSLCGLCVFLFAYQAWAGYVNNGDGTVTDTSTGLMWQQATAPNTYDWYKAISYCESLSFAGYTDWRLPTIDEIKSLLDTRWLPTIDHSYFPDTAASWYWSSTTSAYYTPYAWYVNFSDGDVYGNDKNGSNYVRAVRSGQPVDHSVISVSPASRDVSKVRYHCQRWYCDYHHCLGCIR